MFYGILIDSAGNITSQHAGPRKLHAPWIEVTDKKYKSIGPGAKWVHGNLVAEAPVSVLTAAQAARVRLLTAACAEAITGGFTSSALGSPHTYGSSATDQANMTASAVAALAGAATWKAQEWCADGNGAWGFVAHDAKQIIQVHTDMTTMIAAARTRLAQLKADVAKESSIEGVKAVSW